MVLMSVFVAAALVLFVVSRLLVRQSQRICPYCVEWISRDATVCKHCHENVTSFSTHGPSPRTS
jgi:predicted amidophosphoribosyltransferase